MPSAQYNIHDAKTQLSRIIDRVERGEEIVIGRAGTPVAKIVPLVRDRGRTGRGSLKGLVRFAPAWIATETTDAP
jgi:prevent-host-death family protein